MDFKFIAQTPLFNGISPEDIKMMYQCLNFHFKDFLKGETIYLSGTKVQEIGLIISGSVQSQNIDLWGNKNILSVMGPGQIFAIAYATLNTMPILVDIVAVEDTHVLFINLKKIYMEQCNHGCKCNLTFFKNLLAISSRKNIELSHKIFDSAPKTIRGRLNSYFSREIAIQNSREIIIPFNRQQMADYLNLDRSALSKELCRMRNEGLLDFYRNRFKIKY